MSRPSLLDPEFRYTPSHLSDIKRTFQRIRREQAEAKAQTGSDTVRVLTTFDRRRKAEANDDRR